MTITEVLKENVAKYGGDTALVEISPEVQEKQTWREFELVEPTARAIGRREITWQEFDGDACRFANMLTDMGVQKGNKVAILLMNCIEWLPIYFGILKTGALAVPMNFRFAANEIAYCCDLAEVDVLVFGPEFTERIDAVRDKMQGVKNYIFVGGVAPGYAVNFRKGLSEHSPEYADAVLTEDDDAAIYFSSGTTGFPKAILHTHRSLISSCITENKHHGQTKEDVFLCIPPLYHTGAKMHWFGSFLVGGKAVLLRGVKPRWILKTASEEKATIVWLLVPWAQDILDALDRGELDMAEYDLSTWRLMHIGAQPVPPSLIKRWKERFPSHDYDTNYGLSESIGPGCVHLGVENIHKVGAIGIAGYGWETKIIDENGKTVARGAVGELAVKGPGVMKCYYRDEAATEAVLHDGWLYTGDMAMEDADGFIFLVDRKKDVIITGGENLYPVQIEDFLRASREIKDAAVIGLPDDRLGEIAAAIIELQPGSTCTEEDINTYCEALPRYKRPRKIIFAEVPRNATGKIEKPKLRQMYCGESLVKKQTEK
ncbi:MAG: long-chain fatty acid--CoA ligase [Ruminococcaceae bacterium]|nr:long-chain fatty acid--CoA ligase [Oscillospiraceae bacterium]